MDKETFLKHCGNLARKGWTARLNRFNDRKSHRGRGVVQLAPPGRNKATYSPARAVLWLVSGKMLAGGWEEEAFRRLAINGDTKKCIEEATSDNGCFFLSDGTLQFREEMLKALRLSSNPGTSSR